MASGFITRRGVLGAGAALPLIMKMGPALAQERPSITVAMQEIRTEMDPLHPRAIALTAFRVLESIYDKPLRIDYDAGGEPVPALAERIEQVDDTTHLMTLRRGVLFHDGSEMRAEDVAFTFGSERMRNEDAPGYGVGQQSLALISDVEVVDDYTVRITTSAPDPIFQRRWAGVGTGIISRAAYEAADDFETWARNPIAAGPYKVVDMRENDFILLEAHDDYWGGMPPLQSIRFQMVSELSARIAGLRAGDFDIITTVSPDQIETIEANAGFDVVGGDNMHFRTLAYDVNHPVLADPRVRQAMNLAIDRELIVESLWSNRISIPRCHQNPGYGPLYDASRAIPAYDPDRARQLLQEAGYSGELIPFRTVGSFYTAELATTQVLVEMWRAVGLNIEIQVKENWGQVLDPVGRGFNNSSDGTYYPDPLASLWTRWGETGAFQSRGYWSNEEFNQLGKTLVSSTDQQERRDAFQRMLDIWCNEDPPGTVLHSLGEFFGKRADIIWEPTQTALLDFRPGAISFS
ncbi:MAG: ABC transporter substrate-binding protein [Phyllobacteriaceae bacterium]|jgi:peptide/nickel transport system substrate-binding protein|nr:ABC transporter substrate-binding protein [Phyllobacteriaceae bacterium]